MLSLRSSFSSLPQPLHRHKYKNLSPIRKPNSSSSSSFVCLRVGVEDIAEIVHNKALVAATISAAIGQLSKPFTTSLLYGENVNLRRFIGSGGFPSSHSSGVVAAATTLGLERGFSDSIFGMSVILAAIVMYDAQAVRWEVGKHAKILNKSILFKTQSRPLPNGKPDTLADSDSQTSMFTKSEALAPLLSVSENTKNPPLYHTSDKLKKRPTSAQSTSAMDTDPVLEETWNTAAPLEESIGHTLVDVIAVARCKTWLTSLKSMYTKYNHPNHQIGELDKD